MSWELSILCGLAAAVAYLVAPALVLRKKMRFAKSSVVPAFLVGVGLFAYVRLVLAFPQSLPYATIALVGIGAILVIVARRRRQHGR